MEWLVMLRGPTSDFGPSLNLSLGNSLAIRGNPLVSSSSLHANAEASEPVYGHHGEVISAASRSAGLVVHRGARCVLFHEPVDRYKWSKNNSVITLVHRAWPVLSCAVAFGEDAYHGRVEPRR